MKLRVLALAIVLAWAVPAGAQQAVTLEFNGGLVSLSAQNAPVRVILAEWARLGGATIVNGDRLAGPPVTLELTNVTERQALDTLLRGAAGYMLAPRRDGTTGVSAFDRIMILPTSVGPRTNPAPAPAASPIAGPRPLLPRPPAPNDAPFAEEPAVEEAEETAAEPPPATGRPFGAPLGAPRPLIPPTPRPGAPEDDAPADEAPDNAPVQTTPTNPFGVPFGSSSTPGVISAPRPSPSPQGR
jgi:hypothetical protein